MAEKDFISKLLAIGEGGCHFFASCLLHLSPEELKACRLVHSTWDKIIKDRVWGNGRGRMKLKEKLIERWNNADPIAEEFGKVREEGVDTILCNDAHVFCGLESGKVGVYNLNTHRWVRDLMPGQVDTIHINFTKLSGSKALVAALMWGSIVTVWSSKDEMEQLHCFNVINHHCMDASCEHSEEYDVQSVDAIRVVGSKVVILRDDWWQGKTSLIVVKQGEQDVWENRTLACIPSDLGISYNLATDKDWIAVAKWTSAQPIPDRTEVKLGLCQYPSSGRSRVASFHHQPGA